MKYSWHAFVKTQNLLWSPENLCGMGTPGSGGRTTTMGVCVVVAGEEIVGGGDVRGVSVDLARDSGLLSSWK